MLTSRPQAPATPTVVEILRRTRALTAVATSCLALQLFGNLYEELVSNVGMLADPRPGGLVGVLDPGSPVYYYLPWAPLGVVLVAVLAFRLPRLGAPTWVGRRMRAAVGALGVAVAAKVVLIVAVNPRFRDPGAEPAYLRDWAIVWAVGNGVAMAAVAAAIVLVLAWRPRLLDAGR